LRLNFKQVSFAAILAPVIASLLILAGELATSSPEAASPTIWSVYAVIAVFAWPFCWAGLVVATLVLNEKRVRDWVWHPVFATLVGAMVGLILGIGLAIPVGFVPWIGAPYGAASGLIAGLMFQRTKLRNG
jgi:hypothetical protein